jgi:hypothetical protein
MIMMAIMASITLQPSHKRKLRTFHISQPITLLCNSNSCFSFESSK